MEPTPNSVQNKLHVKYDTFSAHYANQAIIVGASEEIYLDFSSGIIIDPASGQSLLPIHTRIAMTYGGAHRLLQALQQTLSRQATTPAVRPSDPAVSHAAALPRLEGE